MKETEYSMTSHRDADQEPLRVLRHSIAALETYLAKAHEERLREIRTEKDRDKLIEKAYRTALKLYIIIKHQMPEKLEEYSKTLDPLSPEQRKNFLDQVAILEATKLDEILGEKSL